MGRSRSKRDLNIDASNPAAPVIIDAGDDQIRQRFTLAPASNASFDNNLSVELYDDPATPERDETTEVGFPNV